MNVVVNSLRTIAALGFVSLLALGVEAESLPSDQAIKEGFSGVKEYVSVLKPLVIKALPAKEYGTIIAAAKELERATFKMSKLQYSTHLRVKDSVYRAERDSMSLDAQAFNLAAERYDTTEVCRRLISMNDHFEKAMGAIIAIKWPAFDQLHATAEFLYENTVLSAPRKKIDTAKVLAEVTSQMAAFAASSIPPEVTIASNLVDEERAYYAKIIEKMNAAWAARNSVGLNKQITDLKIRLRNFQGIYLQ